MSPAIHSFLKSSDAIFEVHDHDAVVSFAEAQRLLPFDPDAMVKSLAFRLTLRDDERTLTDAELDEAVARVVSGLTDDLGARFRT